jgi:hypothetical protein
MTIGTLLMAFAGQMADFLLHHQVQQRQSGFSQLSLAEDQRTLRGAEGSGRRACEGRA